MMKGRPMRKSVTLALIAAGAAALGAAPANAQNVVVERDGTIQVGFPGANCSVFYNAQGRRTGNRPGCNSGHLQRADAAVAQRFGPGGPGYGPGGRPHVSIDRNGRGEVVFADRRCTVRYDRRGRRTGADRQCSRPQLLQADMAMAEYLRAQGPNRPGWGQIPPWNVAQQPRIWISPANGRGSVYFDGRCTIRYDRYGRREGADRTCTRRQLSWADDAMQRYRWQQGLR